MFQKYVFKQSFHEFIGTQYEKFGDKHGCCIEGGLYHERCIYNQSNGPQIKEFCDIDAECKGYVMPYQRDDWEIATTSTCKLGGQKQDVGNTGVLSENGNCGDWRPTGCYIKQSIFYIYINN